VAAYCRRYMHVLLTTTDVALLVQLVSTAFELKSNPLTASRDGQPLAMLLNCVLRFCIECVIWEGTEDRTR
jgi:hypothetical protein